MVGGQLVGRSVVPGSVVGGFNKTKKSVNYPATNQTSSRKLSKQVKLSASHVILSKLMQSYLAVSVNCRDQDCISC